MRRNLATFCLGTNVAAQAKVTPSTLSRARKLLGVRQGLVGNVGEKASFRVCWLPRVVGDDFAPTNDPMLLAMLRNRQERGPEGRADQA
jgi:hypothetical protein